MENLEYIQKIPSMPQSQESAFDQLKELILIANRVGLYDAADWIQRRIKDYLNEHEKSS